MLVASGGSHQEREYISHVPVAVEPLSGYSSFASTSVRVSSCGGETSSQGSSRGRRPTRKAPVVGYQGRLSEDSPDRWMTVGLATPLITLFYSCIKLGNNQLEFRTASEMIGQATLCHRLFTEWTAACLGGLPMVRVVLARFVCSSRKVKAAAPHCWPRFSSTRRRPRQDFPL